MPNIRRKTETYTLFIFFTVLAQETDINHTSAIKKSPTKIMDRPSKLICSPDRSTINTSPNMAEMIQSNAFQVTLKNKTLYTTFEKDVAVP
ncbi:hypothetical protein BAT02nite_28800 [Bacillus atrophaeus]|nr:hypothetical protein BAT02nite_28800 [Bacillus atrophaeus]